MAAPTTSRVTIRRALPHESREVLGLSIAQPWMSSAEGMAHVEAFLAHARAMKLDLSRQWVATDGLRAIAACTCIHSPGRMSMLQMPADLARRVGPEAAVQLLEAACADAFAAGNVLVQVLTDGDGGQPPADVLAARGFFRLARLRYLELQPLSKVPDIEAAAARALEWVTYSDKEHARFAAVVDQTYRDSQDCPALTGLRSVEDALAGHRGCGYFRPERWLLLRVDGRDAGCLLLSEVPLRGVLEVAYMGLIPPMRGRGLGQRLLSTAIEVARVDGFSGLCLAVDTKNEAALRLYARCGFRPVVEKTAWLRAPFGADKG